MMPAAAASGCSSSVPSLPPPRPKSPPEYPDLYGKRRETAKVQMLEREIGFLEEELKSVQRLQPASRCCKEVTDYVVAKADPLIPTNRKNRRSCRFWKWLCGVPCFNFSWICCCCYSGGSLQLELPRCCDSDCNLCSCPSCGSCCPSCDSCCPSCGSCFPSCGSCCPSCGSCCPSCGSCIPSCGSCFPSCGSCCPSCGSCPSCVSCPAPKWRCCSCPRSNCCKNISCSRKCCVFQFPSCPDCSCCCRWKCSCPKFPKVSLCCNCRKCCCNPCSCNPCCLFF